MSWWNELGHVFQPDGKKNAGAAAPDRAPKEGRAGGRLRQTARTTEGFEAQDALFRPPKAETTRKTRGPEKDETTTPRAGSDTEVLSREQVEVDGAAAEMSVAPEAEQGEGMSPAGAPVKQAGAGPAVGGEQVLAPAAPEAQGAPVVEPVMPNDFTNEGVLSTWVTQFNLALMKQTVKGKNPKLAKLKGMGWADASGLNLEMLKAAAASWEPKAPKKKKASKDAPVPEVAATPVTTAKVLGMLAASNGIFRGVIGKDYAGKCLQFSDKMVKEMGAQRADGSDSMGEKRGTKAGALSGKYRGKHLKELPNDLPAGYQICIVSMPEWGFTEVGNHWFISAGDGFYVDNTGGVFTGAAMTSNLRNTTAEQWAGRVVDKEFGSHKKIRAEMGETFLRANDGFRRFSKNGRTLNEKKKTVGGKNNSPAEMNPGYKNASALETEGFNAIKSFVLGNATYHPRIWLVEPTTKVGGGGK